MRTTDDENQNVLFFKLPPPEVEPATLSCGLALIGFCHAEKSTNLFTYNFGRIAESGSKPERPRRFAKFIVQLQGELSPLLGVTNVQG
jgi:hypothetical protein